MATARYTAEDIEVLEGLRPVRVRPAMYIGPTDSRGLEHMLLEVVSNSIDEHISNHADQLSVSFDDEAVVVEDNGRGIPVELVPGYGLSALEVVLTRLHSGATFDGHQPHVHIRPGFHGVGLAIVNALSERFEAEVHRDGGHYRIALSQGLVTEPFHRVGPSTRTGTRIRYRADPEIFGSAQLDSVGVLKRLKTLSWLTPDLTWTVQGQTTRSGGLIDCLLEETGGEVQPGSLFHIAYESPVPPKEPNHRPIFGNAASPSVQIDAVIGLSQEPSAPRVFGFLNYASLSEGSHVAGVLEGIERAFPRQLNNLAPRVVAAVHLGLLHPDFEGPTRAVLHVPEVQHLIADALFQSLSEASDTRIAWLAAARERRPGRGSEGRDS